MKKVLNLAMYLLVASLLFVSCSDDDDINALPELKLNAGIVLQNGESIAITATELSFTDLESEALNVIYTVVEAPANGKLVNTSDEAISITSFTQQDILDNKIMYIHGGSLSLTDSFLFSVTDGDNVSTDYTFLISIGEKQIGYFYVLNEGSTNGSITLIDRSGTVTQNYYKSVTGLSLGKYTQSMAFSDKYALIAVTTGSGAGYVEIVNKDTFEYVETIEGLSYPREITVLGDIAYVSNGSGATAGDKNEVLVINLTSFEIVKRIEVGAGPEKMVLSGDKLYVANSGGYSNSDKTVSVINTSSNEVVETITVKSCPKDMVVDANGDVWIYCAGVPDYSNYPDVSRTDFGLSKITTSNNEVVSFDLPEITAGGMKNIAISGDKKVIYYMSDAVYAMDYNATVLPTEKFLDETFYGIDVNPVNGNVWCCSISYVAVGSVIVYNKDAQEQKSFVVGNIPNSTTFRY
jgi:YVTN family beta-propeller protein